MYVSFIIGHNCFQNSFDKPIIHNTYIYGYIFYMHMSTEISRVTWLTAAERRS